MLEVVAHRISLFCRDSSLKQNMLFLGNYVDYGDHQLHVICLLLLLKVGDPSSFFLLRGKHESSDINGQMFGQASSFANACENCFGPDEWQFVWNVINDIFMLMPFEAAVDRDYYCGTLAMIPGMEVTEVQALLGDDCVKKVRFSCRSVSRWQVHSWSVQLLTRLEHLGDSTD
jgi:hypothetical protein